MNSRPFQLIIQRSRSEKIINTPTGILLSRLFEQRATGLDDSDVVTVRVRVLGGNVNIKSAEGASSQSGEDRTNEIEQLKERIAELEQAR